MSAAAKGDIEALERGAGFETRTRRRVSFRPDVGRPNDLGPLLGLVGDMPKSAGEPASTAPPRSGIVIVPLLRELPDEQPTSTDSRHRRGNLASTFDEAFRQWTQRAILDGEDANGALLRRQFDGQYLERQAFAAEPHKGLG
jgi:hypothetical protein